MVLITKGKKEYRGIGLVEVMWKVVAEILNLRLTASITFHDFLHIFRAGRGTGTATLEAMLLQQLTALRVAVPVPRSARKSWGKSWKLMEAVSRRFKIAATTFHITSTRPIPRYSFFPLIIRTTAYHMASSFSFPSRTPSVLGPHVTQ